MGKPWRHFWSASDENQRAAAAYEFGEQPQLLRGHEFAFRHDNHTVPRRSRVELAVLQTGDLGQRVIIEQVEIISGAAECQKELEPHMMLEHLVHGVSAAPILGVHISERKIYCNGIDGHTFAQQSRSPAE